MFVVFIFTTKIILFQYEQKENGSDIGIYNLVLIEIEVFFNIIVCVSYKKRKNLLRVYPKTI